MKRGMWLVARLIAATSFVDAAPPAHAVPAPDIEFIYDTTVRKQYSFANTADAISYAHGICDKITGGASYGQVIGDVKNDVLPERRILGQLPDLERGQHLLPCPALAVTQFGGQLRPAAAVRLVAGAGVAQVGRVGRGRVDAPEQPGESRDAVFQFVAGVVVRVRIHAVEPNARGAGHPPNTALSAWSGQDFR